MALVWVTYSASAILASSYWLLPELLGFRANFKSGTAWALFTTKDMYFLSPTSALPFAMRGVYRDWTAAIAAQVVDNRLIALALAAGFAVPICAALASFALAKRAGATEMSLLIVGAIALVMANGTSPPVGDAYARLASAPLVNQVAFVLFKGPYKWVPLALFVMLFLGTATLAALLSSAGRAARTLGASGIAALSIWALVLGSPLLTGNLASYMTPVQPPEALLPSLAHLAAIARNEETKAVWLPFSVTGDPLNPQWVPSRAHLPLIDGGVPSVTSWLAPSPISSRGVSWLGPAPGRIRDQFIEHVILDEPQAPLGSVINELGCHLIVLRMDVTPGPDLASLVAKHSDVGLVFQDRYFAVYKSLVPLQTSGPFNPIILVGGLDSLAIGPSIGTGALREGPFVLASDIPPAYADMFVASSPEVRFAPGKGWADLSLDTWSGNGRIVNAVDYVKDTVPLSAWDKDSFESNVWVPFRLAGLKGSLYEPSIASAFLVATGPAEVTLPLSATDINSEVWARVFVSPLGNSISARASGGYEATAETFADTTIGWRWIRLLRLPSNTPQLLNISVDGQLSSLDQVAIVPIGSVDSTISRLKSLTSGADVVTGGSWQGLALAPPSIKADAIKAGSGMIVKARSGIPASPAAVSGGLPTIVSGYSHQESGLWAFALNFASQDWSSAEALSLDLVTSANAPDYPDIALLDRSNHFLPLSYSVAGPAVIRVFPLAANRIASQAGANFDFSHVTGIDFSFPTYVDPRHPVSVELRSATTDNRSDYSRVVDSTGPGAYVIAVEPTSITAIKQVQINGRSVRLGAIGNGWSTTAPVSLADGPVVVTIKSNDVGSVVMWRHNDALSSVQTPSATTSAPGRSTALQELNYFENFDAGWSVRGGEAILHYRANAFINGYVGYWQSGTAVNYYYRPDDWITRGRVVSISLLALTGVGWLLFALLNRTRSVEHRLHAKRQ